MASTSKQKELEALVEQEYIPSEIEKRRAVTYYLGAGLLLGLYRDTSPRERRHMKEAIGWWIVFVLLIFVSVPFVRLLRWWMWFLWWLILVVWVGVLIWLMRRALSGNIAITKKSWKYLPFPFLERLGWWVLQLFEESDREDEISPQEVKKLLEGKKAKK